MSKFRKNQDGIGLTELVIIFVILLILALIGWYSWQSFKNRDQPKSTNNSQNDAQNSAPPTTPSEESNESIVIIKPLGLDIKVKNSLKDINFVSKSGQLANKTKYSTVNISSATLISLDSKCKATVSAAPLGTIYKTNGVFPANADDKNSVGQLIKQFDKFYVSYSGPKSYCSNKKNAQDEEDLLKNDLNSSLSSIEING